MSIEVTITDNSEEIMKACDEQVAAALEAIGNQCVSHAKQNITSAGRVDTGALRNSISHQVSDKTAYVGTNLSYAIYNEYGTGIFADGGAGRKTPWFYVDAKGVGHWTHGMKPIHFLKDAAANHVDEYKAIIEQYLNR